MTKTEMEAASANEVRESQDFVRLGDLLTGLVGQSCLHAELTSADELVVRFGIPLQHKHSRMAGKTQGSWELNAVATPWMFRPVTTSLYSYNFGFTPADFADAFPVLQEPEWPLEKLAGALVVAAELSATATDLMIRFNNNSLLVLLGRYAKPDVDTPVWELMLPDATFLQVFGEPLPTWSRLRSVVPVGT